MNYRTPGVYVEEVSKLPASVAQSETAIPAFIGYTELTEAEGESLLNKPIHIDSMMDYEKFFGGSSVQEFEVDLKEEEPHLPENLRFKEKESPFLMHHALNLFFSNGGGSCYIVSTGGYTDSDGNAVEPEYDALKDGLDSIIKNQEITLIVIPEAIRLSDENHYVLCNDVLLHCDDQVNRFGIFDVRKDDQDASGFRNGVSSGPMDKAAAYYPHLKTTIRYPWQKNKFTFKSEPFENLTWLAVDTVYRTLDLQEKFERAKSKFDESTSELREASESDLSNDFNKKQVESIFKDGYRTSKRALGLLYEALEGVADEDFSIPGIDEVFDDEGTTQEDMEGLLESGTKADRQDGAEKLYNILEKAYEEFGKIVGKINEETDSGEEDQNDEILKYYTSDFTSALKKLLDDQRITMPPSPAIAGVYAKVDADRGVWKSPANVSLNRVTGPSVKLTISENDRLNVHSSGKSINAIRAFPGKGTLVWGARTLDGGSNEWRYISVRRFFNMVEDSVKSASGRFVFEPNDAGTWVKVKAMIENFLTTQWRAGALMGSKPEEAFYVHIGLGKTMDEIDILEGKMIIEIGMAVVRPAEFIILRFSHKMMES
ncbi:MAG: phage tail sheath family protein [Balneolaceae bacterium]|nr:phage tail sheath family protein [Balneolaceae bacterium]